MDTLCRSQIFSEKQRGAGWSEKYTSLILSEQEQRKDEKNKRTSRSNWTKRAIFLRNMLVKFPQRKRTTNNPGKS